MTAASLTNAEVARQIQTALAPMNVVPMENELPDEPSLSGLRRYRKSRFEDSVGVLTLLDIDGVLVWEQGAVNPTTSTVRRRRAGTASDGVVVTQLKYTKALGVNEISERLIQLDRQLTPKGPATLLQYDPATGTATDGVTPVARGRILLLLHGTFSNSQRIVDQIRETSSGQSFFRQLSSYDQVLGYDHFTLSRTPMLNALSLARALADSEADIDILCHSRGGLVARWFVEALDRQTSRRRRVVFVGCPLQGTSLADPQSLRNGLNLLTNVGKLLGTATGLIPFLAAAGGLMQVVSSVGAVAAKTPVIDAGVGLVPGLAAMSRIKNNAELDALNSGPPQARANYFAITSNFSTDAIAWRFLRLFNRSSIADMATDYLVFQQENDLVVDTDSMTFHAFGNNPNFADQTVFRCFQGDTVHHTNYFAQPETLSFVSQSFSG